MAGNAAGLFPDASGFPTMTDFSFEITAERPDDAAAIDVLHQIAFGPGRFARTAFRLREGIAPIADLCFAARAEGQLVGSVRFTPILAGTLPGLLLGPLAVLPGFNGRGIGKALVRHGLDAAARGREAFVLLVGDLPYYGPLGFERVAVGRLGFPGPVDPLRLLVHLMAPERAGELAGAVRALRPR